MKLPRPAAIVLTLVTGSLLAAVTMLVAGTDAPVQPASAIDFNRDVRPIFQAHCYECHGPTKQKGGIRLDDATALKGGDSNEPLLVSGNAAKSHLLKLVKGEDPDDLMPPKKKNDPLPAKDIQTLTLWVDQGGAWGAASPTSQPAVAKQTHWSFIPPVRPETPTIRDGSVRNPIDAFILARILKEGLRQSPEADRHALIRRLSFDLIGLPPTSAEVDRFVKDQSPDAYEKLVDRLLANPHFGERWARPWLDLARYADSAGYGSDPLRFTIHRYRDWVIDAFNQNKPYDQFTIEQLAGDLLPNPTTEQLIATAFHRNTMTNTEGGTDDEEFRVAAVKDRTDVTGQVWMGLTLGCAQCHTHKYDPITNREYYQMVAIFNQTEDSDKADESPKIATPDKGTEAKRKSIEDEIARLEKEAKESPKLREQQAKWEDSLANQQPLWTPLHFMKIESKNGQTVDSKEDGSVVLSGKLPKIDELTLWGRTGLKGITAFRLEAMTDDSLPAKGPGRSAGGNFVLSEFAVTARASGESEKKTHSPIGRYVRIELPGKQQMLSLAEVQVFSEGQNIAIKGKAKQSSTDFEGPANLAIDGNTDGDFRKAKSTTHTKKSNDPWWELDLGGEHPLDRVVIWNRTDEGDGARLANFKISVLDAKRDSIWSKTIAEPPSPSLMLPVGMSFDVTFTHASTDFAQEGDHWAASRSVDGVLVGDNGWAIAPQVGKPHTAVFETAGQVGTTADTELVVNLTQNYEGHLLGRFRISATTQPHPVRMLPADVASALAIEETKRTDQQKQIVHTYFLSISPATKGESAKVMELKKQLAAMKPAETAIMRELPPNRRRPNNILVKGNFLNKGDPVEPKVLGAFNPPTTSGPMNRLDLARWLVARDNPLTARVQVNRIWAQFFGVGLVETQEDFGEMGSLPSHPELLDWLAVEFMQPAAGGAGWDMKRLMRLIVTSATYRQSARVTPELLEKDARNRFLARMPRQRLDAEMVRDQALSAAGLLSEKMFGPSVYPPQPDGMWQAAFNGQRTYPTSTGEDRYRRGVYVFWRRTVPYPSMQTFDAPSREVCTIRRIHTCTPLQAFVTMNDPVYVECSQALGRRLIKEGGESIESRVRFGLDMILQRPPSEKQIQALVKLYEDEFAAYQANIEEAKKLATQPIGPLPEGVKEPEAAAWTVVANVLLNLDGAMTR